MYDAFPWLMHHFPGPHQEVFAFNDFMHNLVMNEVHAHEREKAGDPQDLIDFYLAQIEKVSICLPHKPLLGLGAYYKYLLLSNYYRILICTLCLARKFFAAHHFHPLKPIATWPEVSLKISTSQSPCEYILQTKDDPTSTFNKDNMVQTVVDLLLGGTETTSTTLLWALLYMVKYPEIQGE